MGQSTQFSITTSSRIMSANDLPMPAPPVVSINGKPLIAQGNPSSPTGYRVLVFDDTMDYQNPSAILLNSYVPLIKPSDSNRWTDIYTYVYDGIVREILSAGNPDRQLVILSSFGLDKEMAPNNAALSLLLGYGAGPEVQKWENATSGGGSQVANSSSWVSFPANYIFVGFSNRDYGQGSEVFQQAPAGETSISSSLVVNVSDGRFERGS